MSRQAALTLHCNCKRETWEAEGLHRGVTAVKHVIQQSCPACKQDHAFQQCSSMKVQGRLGGALNCLPPSWQLNEYQSCRHRPSHYPGEGAVWSLASSGHSLKVGLRCHGPAAQPRRIEDQLHSCSAGTSRKQRGANIQVLAPCSLDEEY